MIARVQTHVTRQVRTPFSESIASQIDEGLSLRHLLKEDIATLLAIADVWIGAFQSGGKVIFLGNGGSAADAQHFAAELAGKLYLERDPLPAIALTSNGPALTALGNDLGYDNVFSRQVMALAKPGDVVVGICTSGNSPNVLLAIEAAKEAGAITVAFTGAGGKLAEIADYVLAVPSTDTPRIQEIHVTAGHLICYVVERSLFGKV